MQYRISLEAEEDLIRIFRYGREKFGESQAIKYYFGLIGTFEKIAANPFSFPSAEHIRPGYRSCPYAAKRGGQVTTCPYMGVGRFSQFRDLAQQDHLSQNK